MVASSLTSRHIRADFFTPGYRIVGEVRVSSTGFTGLLNDDTTAFMEIYSASVAHIHMPTKLVDCYQVLRVVKNRVVAVSFKRREDVGPQALARGGYAQMSNYPVWITTGVYEIQGTLEWAGRFNFSTVMVEGTRDFVPLYNASMKAILFPASNIESAAMMFNRRQVEALGLKNQLQQVEKYVSAKGSTPNEPPLDKTGQK